MRQASWTILAAGCWALAGCVTAFPDRDRVHAPSVFDPPPAPVISQFHRTQRDLAPVLMAEDPVLSPAAAPPVVGAPRAASGAPAALPHIRIDAGARVVEFDGIVPIDTHDPATPRVYLEVIACTADTKEHESLVMTRARPSDVHAALLAIGLEPGFPGSWREEGDRIVAVEPRGEAVVVELAYRDGSGREVAAPAAAWIINAETGEALEEGGFVFAGSRIVPRAGRDVYDADGVGTLVGLHTFGAETIAWRRVMSPDSSVEEPEWIANAAAVPAMGTGVVVRIRPASR